jgi:hypothetical protein
MQLPKYTQLTGFQQGQSRGDCVQGFQRYLPRLVVSHARRVVCTKKKLSILKIIMRNQNQFAASCCQPCSQSSAQKPIKK